MPNRKRKKALIFEGSLRGHRANFVSILAGSLLDLGLEVELCCPSEGLSDPEAQAFLTGVLDRVTVRSFADLPKTMSAFQNANQRLDRLVHSVKESDAGSVYIPYADGLAQAWGSKFRVNSLMPDGVSLEGLMMRGSYAYATETIFQKLKSVYSQKTQTRPPWDRLFYLDAIAFHHLKSLRNDARIQLMPEPIEASVEISREEACLALGLNQEDLIIACPGGVSSTKGCDLLIKAISLLPQSFKAKLILLGRHSQSVKEMVSQIGRPDRVVSIDRFATPHEFDCLFSAADLIALLYPRHVGSSSILLRAALRNKPIVASDWGWIGWATKEFGAGDIVDCGSMDAIVDAIERALTSIALGRLPTQSDRLKQFLEFHTPQNHAAHWLSGICERLGVEKPNLVDHPIVENWCPPNGGSR